MNITLGKKPISEYVSNLGGMQNNREQGDLKDRVVADLATNDPNIHEAILTSGARLCYVVGDGNGRISDPRLVPVAGTPWDAKISNVDVAFFDTRAVPGFDPMRDIRRLMAHMRESLTPQGVVFAVVSTGNVLGGFETVNPIVQTPIGPLPSSEYLLDELLKDCAVRILDWLPSEHPTVTTRFMRLTHKKPSLLLICGHSQSGKTSLARELAQLDRHMHVSNDFIYCEIIRLRQTEAVLSLPPEIVELLGDGGGEACGLFNRALENSPDLMHKYLSIVESVLPRDKQLISMDLDVRTEQGIEFFKEFFVISGYSVWVVRR